MNTAVLLIGPGLFVARHHLRFMTPGPTAQTAAKTGSILEKESFGFHFCRGADSTTFHVFIRYLYIIIKLRHY